MTGALLALVGCGGAMPEDELGANLATADQAQQVDNGLSTNGLSTNGLSTNGLSTNGLSTNGLSTNGFNDWFNQNADMAPTLMAYIVKCAVPEGQTRTFQSPTTGTKYTWQGALGLAPGWAAGKPATVTEQQSVSACLAAHANKYGLHIALSVLGRTAEGAAVPYSAEELSQFSAKEGCFFGNLFTNEGLFAARDRDFSTAESSTRACGLTLKADTCAPITNLGSCSQFCTKGDPSQPYYTQCTYNGKTYPAITTRVQPTELFRCGDGVCQFTEHAGTGTTADSCRADCGA
ncbi:MULTISPECIES: hypothetical protein [unclassified Corallococcus]|uniref:hypothetical protein n=1 Tax=unclassified Corallococcus TaxID=2685029 RepID=UPI001A8CD27D|nr:MULTISPECIES: hypothetical protein [unclassified Corallococcus]MBN9688324.1 hypothetical protein [Corallococcus sp. NCSPR001]WAS87874.1 hypothetical protein O0N60_13040 [Corallococcus sp. NCRR]